MAAIDTSVGARADGAILDTNGYLIRVGPRTELHGVTVVSGGRHGIAVCCSILTTSSVTKVPVLASSPSSWNDAPANWELMNLIL